jgi:cellulose synthase/poly-beta-1,6-N-acetylglucosamine synthase-like glycosyltransferase
VLQIPVAVGKAEALRRALAHEKYGELVAVFDADERPAPDVLSSFAAAFSDLRIGGVSGLRAVSNPLAGPAASYSTFETLVHQWITMRAKDRLGLQPASLGSNCAYRRSALEQVGGFTSGLYLEDSEITIRLAQAGWRTRFIPQAFSTHRVPSTLEAYWVQHVRWAQGFQQVNRLRMAEIMADRHLPGALRLELAAFSSGYLDRLFVLITAGFHLVSRPPRFLTSIFAAYLLTPLLQVIAALRISGAPVAFYRKLPILPLFFVIDIAAAFVGFIRSFNKSRGIWRSDLAQGS